MSKDQENMAKEAGELINFFEEAGCYGVGELIAFFSEDSSHMEGVELFTIVIKGIKIKHGQYTCEESSYEIERAENDPLKTFRTIKESFGSFTTLEQQFFDKACLSIVQWFKPPSLALVRKGLVTRVFQDITVSVK